MSILEKGTLLGRYEIIEEVGQGGMSIVYKARDRELQRVVAVKVLHDFLMTQPEARDRFHHEAMAVAKLHHPNIIEIYDYSGEDAPFCYIVTEFVDGTSMAPPPNAQPLEPPEIGLIALRPIADALAHAHQMGIIHRDLKPENILKGKDGSIKLSDFGIARTVDHQNMTLTGTLLGSPAYMAPEYIGGKPIDPRVDIFAFGAMLYQTLTGTLPFEGPTPAALLLNITAGDYTPPNEKNRSIHGEIAQLVNRCLARNPDDRFPTMDAVRDQIDNVLGRIGVPEGGRDLLEQVLCSPRIAGGQMLAELPEVYLELGRVALADGDQSRALDDLDRVLSMDPTNAEVHRLLAALHRGKWTRRVLWTLAAGLALIFLGSTLWDIWETLPPQLPESPPTAAAPPRPETNSAAPILRNVTVVVEGNGTLLIDDIEPPREGDTVTVLLQPGSHTLRLNSPTGESLVEKLVTIPKKGPIAPIPIRFSTPAPTPVRSAAREKIRKRDVSFRTAGAWVNVEVDGVLVAKEKLGLFKVPLTYGQHRLRFTNNKAHPLKRLVTVNDTEPPQVISIRLQPKPGYLRVKGAPNGAIITVAGKKRLVNKHTRDDAIPVPLEPGKGSSTHEVVVKTQKGEIRMNVTFRPTETYELAVDPQAL